MKPIFQSIIDTVAPLEDQFYGKGYRCALTLTDGTFLPCAVLRSRAKMVELAKRRMAEAMSGKGVLRRNDPYGEIVASFATHCTQVCDYEVASAAPSAFAIPLELLEQIEGETFMGWTGWVFEMSDGRLFSYTTDYDMEFFPLPEGYGFSDVRTVHNHSWLDASGAIRRLESSSLDSDDFDPNAFFRDKVSFTCFIDGI
jgi:hypothetical protein